MSVRDLFAIFYGIFFSSVLSSCWGFSFFQWGHLFRSPYKTLRLIVSLFLLNFLPGIYFAELYIGLPADPINSFIKVLCVFVLGFSVFGFYRAYHLFISFQTIQKCLYEENELKPHEKLNEALADRLKRVGSWQGQAVSVVFYFGLAWLSWRLIVK